MSFIDPLGRPVFAPFPNGEVAKSKYQGWCGVHGVVWMYDAETRKPKVNGVCGECWKMSRRPDVLSCAIHGLAKKGPGGRCGECEARGYPPLADNLPPVDETGYEDGIALPQDGVDVRDGGDAKPLPRHEDVAGGETR